MAISSRSALASRPRSRTSSSSAWPVAGARRRSCFPVAAASATAKDPFAALESVAVLRATDGASTPLRDTWDAPGGERALLVLARSFGCPFCQATARELARDVLPALNKSGVRLSFVGIGTAERARDFAARTQLPLASLYADPTNAAYDALNLESSLAAAFLSPQTPLAIARRAARGGGDWKDLRAMLDGWKPWQPPQGVRQALNQGGAYLFDGTTCVWSHRDPATAAHAEPSEMMERALALVAARQGKGGDCGCDGGEGAAATAAAPSSSGV